MEQNIQSFLVHFFVIYLNPSYDKTQPTNEYRIVSLIIETVESRHHSATDAFEACVLLVGFIWLVLFVWFYLFGFICFGGRVRVCV